MSADQLPAWVADYVGGPYQAHGTGPGYDCMSLVQDVHARQFGWHYALPERENVADVEDMKQSSAAFFEGQARLTGMFFSRVEEPAIGDVVLLRVGVLPAHVGVYVGGARMLHILKDSHACIEPINGLAWGNRVLGFFRFRTGTADQ